MIYAGRLVYGVVYTPPRAGDHEHVRQARQKCSSKARQALNMKASYQKLELLLASNFELTDLHVVLTYDDSHLPATRMDANKALKKFFVQLRKQRKVQGARLKYVYVTEGLHQGARLHHHLIINGTGKDVELIRSLWTYGSNVDVEQLDVYGGYEAIAQYLTKEPREYGRACIGDRMWVPSRGLKKPKVESAWVDESTTLSPPPGVTVLDSSSKRNEYGEFAYIKYLIPIVKARKTRPPRSKKTE